MTSFPPAENDQGPPASGGTSPEDPILQVKGLVKDFREIRAVDGIDLAIGAGTCFGLLGPNGAGKTTAIEVIEGILEPTAGEILYKGLPRGPGFRQEIGIQLQETELPQFLTVRETLAMFRNLYDRRGAHRRLPPGRDPGPGQPHDLRRPAAAPLPGHGPGERPGAPVPR